MEAIICQHLHYPVIIKYIQKEVNQSRIFQCEKYQFKNMVNYFQSNINKLFEINFIYT